MNRSCCCVVLVFLAVALPTAAQEQAKGWRTDYAKAKAEAKRTGKPMFVVFRCQP